MDPNREIREREIVQLQREIDANPPLGCMKSLMNYMGFSLFFGIIGIALWMNGQPEFGVLAYIAGMIICVVYENVLKIKHSRRKSRLDKLLKEESEEIKQSKKS